MCWRKQKAPYFSGHGVSACEPEILLLYFLRMTLVIKESRAKSQKDGAGALTYCTGTCLTFGHFFL
jgi:hypothetical protein